MHYYFEVFVKWLFLALWTTFHWHFKDNFLKYSKKSLASKTLLRIINYESNISINFWTSTRVKIGRTKTSYFTWQFLLLTSIKIDSLGNSPVSSSVIKFKQAAKKKARMQGEHIKTTSLRRIIKTRISHNSQAIVSMNKGSQPTSSVTLPCFLTKASVV